MGGLFDCHGQRRGVSSLLKKTMIEDAGFFGLK
jgi:hypothetical protein